VSRRLAIIEGQRAALAYAPPDADLQARVRSLQAENAALRRQLPDRAGQQPEALAHVNDARKAQGARLDAAIRAALATDPGSDAWTAKEVGKALERADFSPLPARRTIADHLKALRNLGGTVRRLRNR
jgi:hypothetical protein